MANLTYPRPVINIQDNSAGSVVTTQVIPLHRPFYFIQAEQGPVGVPVLGTQAQQSVTFGANTFLSTQKFFSHQTLFANIAMAYQQVYLIRVADDTVTQASLVLQLSVTSASIPQYELDSLGARVLTNGAPTPVVDGSGAAVSQPGYNLTWSTRQLLATETADSIATTTSTSGAVTTTTYPIMVMQGTTPGSAVNRSGFQFYYTSDSSATVAADVDSVLYRFAPVVLSSTNTGTTTPVTDIYSANYNDVSLMSIAVDPNTAQDVSMNGILTNNYIDPTTGVSLLNYSTYVYSNNVATIGNQIIAVSSELAGVGPYTINLLSGVDVNGNPYQHFVVESSAVGNSSTTLYLAGGTDGATDRVTYENLVSAYAQNTDNVLFQDYFRFPFSHFYDSGFSLQSKYSLMTLFSLRDDINGTFSTQDTSEAANTQAQDQSTGAAILSRARTYVESVLYGTEAMRAEIYQQCAYLTSSSDYAGLVPMTLDRMVKRCIYYNAQYIKGTPKGRPNSEVTLFKPGTLNWSTATPAQKQLNWDTALNTVSFADISTLFYPDLRSIYTDQTSLLSDGVFVDYLVFLKYVARNRWTYYAGRDDNAVKLFSVIAKDIDTTCNTIFGSRLPTTTVVSQTDADLAAGYACTVTISVTGDLPNRVWNVIIPVSRTAVASTTT